MPRSDYNKNQNVYFLTISRWTEEETIYFLLRIFCRRRHPRYRHFWRRRRWQRRQKRQTGVAFASNLRQQRCCPANNCSFVIFFKQLKKHKFLLPDFFSKRRHQQSLITPWRGEKSHNFATQVIKNYHIGKVARLAKFLIYLFFIAKRHLLLKWHFITPIIATVTFVNVLIKSQLLRFD